MIMELLTLLAALSWLVALLMRRRILNQIPKLTYNVPLNENCDTRVSVIIPARNEEDNISSCLDSLKAQQGVDLEVIVVDDSSSDGTAEVVKRYEDVKLIRVQNPPEGWLGKSWACRVGYESSRGDWLLFTDADAVFHDSMCISKALKLAGERNADAITLYPALRLDTPSLKAVTPILTLALYSLAKPHKVETGESAFMFGSFILIRRDAYIKIGGHESVKDALLEDRALAINARKAGFRVIFADGGGSFSARWNKDLRTLWNGMLRLFLPLFLKSPVKRTTSYLLLIAFLTVTPLASLIYSITQGNQTLLVLSALSTVLAMLNIGVEAAKHKAGVLPVFLWPLGAALMMGASVFACYKALKDPVVEWRGRVYRLTYDGEREMAWQASS